MAGGGGGDLFPGCTEYPSDEATKLITNPHPVVFTTSY